MSPILQARSRQQNPLVGNDGRNIASHGLQRYGACINHSRHNDEDPQPANSLIQRVNARFGGRETYSRRNGQDAARNCDRIGGQSSPAVINRRRAAGPTMPDGALKAAISSAAPDRLWNCTDMEPPVSMPRYTSWAHSSCRHSVRCFYSHGHFPVPAAAQWRDNWRSNSESGVLVLSRSSFRGG